MSKQAYVYQADLHCKDCTKEIKKNLVYIDAYGEEFTYDSDDYPKGPYPEGGGESDCPNHCGSCGVFLENPLTKDGEFYVRYEADKNGLVYHLWKGFYTYLFD